MVMENNKKTVGIVTFHTANNYGAVLQTYALQNYIEDNLNYNVSIIDLHTSFHDRDNKIFRNSSSNKIKSFIKDAITLFYLRDLYKKRKSFELFRSKFLHLTKHCYKTEHDFLYNIEYFDFYISGSDQVFNPTVKHSECYYLNFRTTLKGKKIAYAPSFGINTFTEGEKKKIVEYIKGYSALSCREKEGAAFLSSLTGINVPQVCDPVFLLNKEEWKKIAVYPKIQSPYIFVYDLNGGHKLIELAKKISIANNNIPIICATGHIFDRYKTVKSLYNVGPCELLGLIKNADFVVTDSFHGTSLSLIMNTKIISYIATKHTSSRISSLMNVLGIGSQMIYDVETFDFKNIIFHDYDEKLKCYISKSKEFLIKKLR